MQSCLDLVHMKEFIGQLGKNIATIVTCVIHKFWFKLLHIVCIYRSWSGTKLILTHWVCLIELKFYISTYVSPVVTYHSITKMLMFLPRRKSSIRPMMALTSNFIPKYWVAMQALWTTSTVYTGSSKTCI